MLEQLVNSFLKAPRGKIMNCPKKDFCQKNIIQLVSKKLAKYQYDGSNAPKVCWSSLSTASWRQLGDALLLDIYMLFHTKQVYVI